MARWKVYEDDNCPSCTSCGMGAPFARYRKKNGIGGREITNYCPYCGKKMTGIDECIECPHSENGEWQDNGICFACRGTRGCLGKSKTIEYYENRKGILMGTIKNDSYICIQGFMVNELGLKGTELLVYAIIYGFSQDGSSAFTGTLPYLMQWCCAGKNTVIKALRNLTDRGLLLKTVDTVGGVRVCRYTALSKPNMSAEDVDNYREYVDNFCEPEEVPGSKSEPVVQKLHRGGSKSEPNNINNNLTDNLVDNINIPPCGGNSSAVVTAAGVISQAKIREEFDELWKSYPEGRKQGRKEALAAYQRTRKRGTSYEQIAKGLDSYKRQIEVEQTPIKFVKQGGTWFKSEGWLDDYNTAQKSKNNPALGYRQHNYDADQLRKMWIDLGEDVYIA